MHASWCIPLVLPFNADNRSRTETVLSRTFPSSIFTTPGARFQSNFLHLTIRGSESKVLGKLTRATVKRLNCR